MTARQRSNLWVFGVLLILVAIGLIAWGLVPRIIGFGDSTYR